MCLIRQNFEIHAFMHSCTYVTYTHTYTQNLESFIKNNALESLSLLTQKKKNNNNKKRKKKPFVKNLLMPNKNENYLFHLYWPFIYDSSKTSIVCRYFFI